jgi:hypothetical protein
LPQSRRIQGQNIQPVIQVFPKPARFNFRLQISVGSCHNPNINRHRLEPANRVNRALLQNSQKLDLHVERQVANFIQENGAAVRQLKTANSIGHGTRESAFAVAKKFAF